MQRRLTSHAHVPCAGLAEGDTAIVVDGPDEDGEYTLSNLEGKVVGGEDWIPFRGGNLVPVSIEDGAESAAPSDQ